MNQDEIIEMYLEVSNKLCNGTEWCWAGVGEPLQLFAKLVAAKEREKLKNVAIFDRWYQELDAAVLAEREACAKVCDVGAESMLHKFKREGAARCAVAIRARSGD